jgi:hypothetical protein
MVEWICGSWYVIAIEIDVSHKIWLRVVETICEEKDVTIREIDRIERG